MTTSLWLSLRAKRSNLDEPVLPEQLGGAAQHDSGVADAPGGADRVEIFQDLDRQVAADAGALLEARRGEAALGRIFGERGGKVGESRDRLGQEDPVGGNRRDPPEALDAFEKPGERLR